MAKKKNKVTSLATPHQVVEPRCSTCRHKDLQEINGKLIDGVPATEISSVYSLDYRSVLNHRTNHLSKALQVAERERQKAIGKEIHTFDDRTYLSPLDKLKLAQETALQDFPSAEPNVRQKALQIWLSSIERECKLLGMDSLPSQDKVEEYHKRIAELTRGADPQVEEELRGGSLGYTRTLAVASQICSAFNYIFGVDIAVPSEVVAILKDE